MLLEQIYNNYLRTKAISIVYSCSSVLGAMTGVYRTETSKLMAPLLKLWMGQFSMILEQPVQSEDPDDWSLRMEVIKCMNQVVQNFSGVIESEFAGMFFMFY